MEINVIDEDYDIISRTAVIQFEIEEVSTTQQSVQQDSVLESLSSLTNSMKLFGLYFTRTTRVGPSFECQRSHQVVRKCQDWNPLRIYATIMLVVVWLNAVRYFVVFDRDETLGADLFAKLSVLQSALLIAVLQTAYYVASHSGSLDRVFRQEVSLSAVDFPPKLSRMAKVITVICWCAVTSNIIYYIYFMFTNDDFNDVTEKLLVTTFPLSTPYMVIFKVFFISLHLFGVASWSFTQAMK